MRKLEGFEVEGAESGLTVMAVDEPGSGGAHHVYAISGPDLDKNSAVRSMSGTEFPLANVERVIFQCGGVREDGVNGLTNEVLLAIVRDRLECFQAGPFATQENATALQNVNEALRSLHKRTEARLRRGVEGKQVA